MSAINVPFDGTSALWIEPLTLDTGEIDALGTLLTVKTIGEATPLYAKSSTASSTDRITIPILGGMQLSAAKTLKDFEMKTGTERTSGASGDADKISAAVMETGDWFATKLSLLRGKPVRVTVPGPSHLDPAADGFFTLIGVLTSEIGLGIKPFTALSVNCEWTGGTAYTATTDGATALAYQLPAITLVDGSTIRPPAFTSGDVTAQLAGTLFWKPAA